MRHTCRAFLTFFLACAAIPATGPEEYVTYRSEHPVDMSEISGYLPDALEEAALAGDVEIRQRIQYDAPARQLIVWTFVASPYWQRPATLVDVQNNQLDQFRVNVSEIRFTESSWRTIEFNGVVATPTTTALMVAGGMGTSLMGAVPGMPAGLVSSYLPAGGEPLIRNLSLAVTGGARWTAPTAVGSVKVESTPNRAPLASVIGPPAETSNFEIGFDAAASTDPDGDALDYKWHVLGGTVALRGCETPTPVFQFNQGPGTYDFRLTLTDNRGATTIQTYRVKYTGR